MLQGWLMEKCLTVSRSARTGKTVICMLHGVATGARFFGKPIN